MPARSPYDHFIEHSLTDPHGYFIAFFDILGFEERMKQFGLEGMLKKYFSLVEHVWHQNAWHEMFAKKGILEPFWVGDGRIKLHYPIGAAYASDSVLVWASRTWLTGSLTIGKHKSLDSLKKLPEWSWAAHPVPCDPFLDVCNELVCRSLEMELPLRGAIAMGEARINGNINLFLGKPIIDAARLEPGQKFLGVTFHNTFLEQTIPKRYSLPFASHLKEDKGKKGEKGYLSYKEMCAGTVLDWPRHWRKTRKTDPKLVVEKLDVDANYSETYKITNEFLQASAAISQLYESEEDVSIQLNYPEFSAPGIFLAAVTIDDNGEIERLGAPTSSEIEELGLVCRGDLDEDLASIK